MYHVDEVVKAFGRQGTKHLEIEEQKLVARSFEALLIGERVLPSTLCRLRDGLLGMVDRGGDTMLFGVFQSGKVPSWLTRFSGDSSEVQGLQVLMAALSPRNAAALREIVPYTRPQILGLKPAFGFGDRIGFATPGHAMAAARAEGRILPVFAQQSIREMSRTERTASQVLDDATWGVFQAGWTGPFGADADHLKTKSDVDVTAQAGFVFFTIDPSEYVDQQADDYDGDQIEERFQNLIHGKIGGASDLIKLYRGRTFEIEHGEGRVRVTFEELSLKRAAVKYGRALAHTYEMALHVAKNMGSRPFELEISVDETPQPTSPLEHLFIALELKRHGTSIVSLAPRFVGDFEKAIDYKGNLALFDESLREHMAIAEQFGPYKISVHSGSDKLSIYPSFGRICKGRFHVKTAGTSYLEALRVVCRVDKELFRSIVQFARQRFETDRATYHISTGLDLVPEASDLRDGELEKAYLDQDHGRQILHVTFGSVLTERTDHGYRFRERIRTILHKNHQLHEDVLRDHLGKHIQMLLMG
ncbi:MAG: tagaturonate epimerase family protein [Thermodesulfobacteriota bacterium]